MSKSIIKIYIAGNTAKNRNIISILEEACKERLQGLSYALEIVDILKNPEEAEKKKILAIPTIAREKPSPEKRTIGEPKNLNLALNIIDFLFNDLPNHSNYGKN